jgi:hypothetical protein
MGLSRAFQLTSQVPLAESRGLSSFDSLESSTLMLQYAATHKRISFAFSTVLFASSDAPPLPLQHE